MNTKVNIEVQIQFLYGMQHFHLVY